MKRLKGVKTNQFIGQAKYLEIIALKSIINESSKSTIHLIDLEI
jgi:hypothetical protein